MIITKEKKTQKQNLIQFENKEKPQRIQNFTYKKQAQSQIITKK